MGKVINFPGSMPEQGSHRRNKAPDPLVVEAGTNRLNEVGAALSLAEQTAITDPETGRDLAEPQVITDDLKKAA